MKERKKENVCACFSGQPQNHKDSIKRHEKPLRLTTLRFPGSLRLPLGASEEEGITVYAAPCLPPCSSAIHQPPSLFLPWSTRCRS